MKRKIIADKLNNLGIPYRYEYPMILEGNIRIHPDFTILKMPERKEVYLGKGLYITYETSLMPR